MICELIDIDIPRLLLNGIAFEYDCFRLTYSLQSSSMFFCPSYSFDTFDLYNVICNMSDYASVDSDTLIPQNATEWIVQDNSFIKDKELSLRIRNKSSLKRIVIGKGCFRCIMVFELDGLSSLTSIVIGNDCFK